MPIRFLNDVAVDTSVLYVDTINDRVGIGTTSPSYKLSINDGGFSMFADGGTSADTFSVVTHNYVFSDENEDAVYSYDGTNGHEFSTQGSPRVRIDQNGNVGIGTTNPTNELTIESATPVIDIKSTNTFPSGQISFLNSGGLEFSGIQAQSNPVTSALILKYVTPFVSSQSSSLQLQAGNLFLSTANSERMRITSTGNVGIGTTSPGAKLTVVDDILLTGSSPSLTLTDATSSFVIKTNTAGEGIVQTSGASKPIRFFRDNGSNESMRINGAGNVGIGTTSPQSKLQVNGGVQLANDTASPSASKVGTFRYRTSGNNSYVDMCMQTGASTYAWVNIVQNTW